MEVNNLIVRVKVEIVGDVYTLLTDLVPADVEERPLNNFVVIY